MVIDEVQPQPRCVAAFVLQGFALANGPVSLVQLVVVMELPFSLVLSRLVLGGRLRAREWSATTAVVVAVLVAGRWARPAAGTALAGVAAGMAAGLIAVLLKAVTSAGERGFVAVLATWQTWALLVVGAAAFFLLQNALQAGRLVASQPGITLANPLVAAVWGVGLLHEQVQTGWWLVGAGVGAALLAAGAVLLSSSPLLDGHQEAPDDGEGPQAARADRTGTPSHLHPGRPERRTAAPGR